MTLTTERQQFEEWFTNKYPRSYWGVEKTASGEYQGGLAAPLWEAWQESRGCMANREAQPVKNTVLFEHSGCGYGVQIDMVTVKLNRGDVVVQISGNIKKVINEKGEQSAVIYTAPPAPAVPEEANPDSIGDDDDDKDESD